MGREMVCGRQDECAHVAVVGGERGAQTMARQSGFGHRSLRTDGDTVETWLAASLTSNVK
jgi:hypothetical protein